MSAVAGVLGSGAMAFTLMACYGGACVGDDSYCGGYPYGGDAGDLDDAARDAMLPDVRVGDASKDASRDASFDATDGADSDGGDGGDGG